MLNAALFGYPERLVHAVPPSLRQELARHVHLLEPDFSSRDWREHASTLVDADVIFSTWGLPKLDAEFLTLAPRLRAVFHAAGSLKPLVTEEAFSRDIVFCSAWMANAIPVAEYAAAAALLSLKNFWAFARRTKQTRQWNKSGRVPGAYLSTVGLVSLGAAGRHTARLLSRHELRLAAYDPFVTSGEARTLGLDLLPLDELFRISDVISIHTPWLPETENLVDESLLRSLKPGATLINTSRGAVIDEAALCRVLAARPDLTAILDVTHPEPPAPDSPLFDLENVLLTPHVAGSMGSEIERMGRWMLDELLAWLNGQPLRHEVTSEMVGRLA